MNISEANSPLVNNIVSIIKDKGLKKTYVANKAGISYQEFSHILNGRRIIKACEIPNIAFALGLGFNVNALYALPDETQSQVEYKGGD